MWLNSLFWKYIDDRGPKKMNEYLNVTWMNEIEEERKDCWKDEMMNEWKDEWMKGWMKNEWMNVSLLTVWIMSRFHTVQPVE